jgi:hypothetical protein
MTLGGFIGSAKVVGVPGADGAGEPMVNAESIEGWDLRDISGGAGLLEDMRREGKSIFTWFATLARVASSSKVK